MVKVTRKDLIDVLHIVLVVISVFVVGQAYFSFVHSHLICDYTETNIVKFEDFGNSYNFTSSNLTLNYIKYVYAHNVTGIFDQNIILEDNRQYIHNCKFKI